VRRASAEGFARVHPFHGAFFLGLAGGYAQTKGTMSEEGTAFRQVQRIQAHAYASTVYLAPHLGFQWMLPMRLTVGFDIGVELPIVSGEPDFDAAKYGLVVPVEGKGSVADATRFVAKSPIPVIHLLEIGYALGTRLAVSCSPAHSPPSPSRAAAAPPPSRRPSCARTFVPGPICPAPRSA
jgi:hypothetical protein